MKRLQIEKATALKNLLSGSTNSFGPVIIRALMSIVLFAHGAQKLLGWFGGYGFEGSMQFFTHTMGLPWIIGFLVILIEFFGAIALLLGFGTRIISLLVTGLMIGIILTSHIQNGFFMNWFGNQKGEGYEYFILVIAMALSLVATGAGKWSVDALLSRVYKRNYSSHPSDRTMLVNS